MPPLGFPDAKQALQNLRYLSRRQVSSSTLLSFWREVRQAYNKVRLGQYRELIISISELEREAEQKKNKTFVRALRASRKAYRRAETRPAL
jgi:hypothetical protein